MRHTCGAEYEPGAILCVCGELIIDDGGLGVPVVTAPGPGSALEQATADQHESAPQISCPRCGRTLEDGPEVCPYCDAWLGGTGTLTAGAPSLSVLAGSSAASLTLPGGVVVEVARGEVVLGRLSDDPRIAQALDFDGVSRRHAAIRADDGRVTVRDLGSTNGTRVAGATITSEVALAPGETELGLGANVRIMVRVR